MDSQYILLAKSDGIARIVLNRPETLNAFDKNMVTELGRALEDAEQDGAVRVVVLTGKGKTFCVGADLKYFKEEASEPWQAEAFYRYANNTMMNRLAQFSKPTIVAVNGAAFGGGFELVMACDLAVAAEDAIIGDQHLNYGIVGPGGGTQRTTYLLGPRKAKEFILMGQRLTGKEAESIGLINRAVPADKLESTVQEMAANLAAKSPVAMRIAKALINRALQIDFHTAEQLEIMSAIVNAASEDYAEGVRAFSEKRKPVFKGR